MILEKMPQLKRLMKDVILGGDFVHMLKPKIWNRNAQKCSKHFDFFSMDIYHYDIDVFFFSNHFDVWKKRYGDVK